MSCFDDTLNVALTNAVKDKKFFKQIRDQFETEVPQKVKSVKTCDNLNNEEIKAAINALFGIETTVSTNNNSMSSTPGTQPTSNTQPAPAGPNSGGGQTQADALNLESWDLPSICNPIGAASEGEPSEYPCSAEKIKEWIMKYKDMTKEVAKAECELRQKIYAKTLLKGKIKQCALRLQLINKACMSENKPEVCKKDKSEKKGNSPSTKASSKKRKKEIDPTVKFTFGN